MNYPELMFLMIWTNPVPLSVWMELKYRSQNSIRGEFWVDANNERIKHFLRCYGPNQKAAEVFALYNSDTVFEHFKMKNIVVPKLHVPLLGGR